MKNLFKNFLKCGLAGWCMEIIFTALGSFRRREKSLTGHTSLWMFPIYGSACLIKPLYKLIKRWSFLARGSIYTACIFLVEFFSGSLLMKKNSCPWNYEHSRWNLNKVIRLDFIPCWFGAGLLFEKILADKKV